MHWTFSERSSKETSWTQVLQWPARGFQGCKVKTQVKPSARCPPVPGWRGVDNCVFWRTEKRIPLHRRERAFSLHAGHPCQHHVAPGRAVLPRIITATASGSARGTKGYLGHNLGGGAYHPRFTDGETDRSQRTAGGQKQCSIQQSLTG